MATGYCPNCKMNVLTTREEINICLVIILLIFSAGIFLLIYFAIYYGKEPNRCVHCKSICQPISNIHNDSVLKLKPSQINNYKEAEKNIESYNQATVESKFCSNCGVKIGEREGLKFCAFCGTKIS
jgi:hypothetical protein